MPTNLSEDWTLDDPSPPTTAPASKGSLGGGWTLDDQNAYTPADIQGLVSAAAKKYGVDEDLAQRVANRENGYKPSGTSPKGAIGPMQLMPGTAQDLGVDPSDPAQNVDGGVRYLGQMLKRYGGDRSKALAAYNFGPANVDAGKPWPPETRDYVQAINANPAAPASGTLGGGWTLDEPASPAQQPTPGPQSTPPPALPDVLRSTVGPDSWHPGAEIAEENDDYTPEQQAAAEQYNRDLDTWKQTNGFRLAPDDSATPVSSVSVPAPASPPGMPAPSKETLDLMRQNVETLAAYARSQTESLNQERRRLDLLNLPATHSTMSADQADIDAFNQRLQQHNALLGSVQASIARYQQAVDAYNRQQIEQTELHNLPIRQAQITAQNPPPAAPRPAGLSNQSYTPPGQDNTPYVLARSRTGQLYRQYQQDLPSALADAKSIIETSPIPKIPVSQADYQTPVYIPNLGAVNLSVIKNVANTVTGQANLETAGVILASAIGGEALAALANSEKAEALLDSLPTLRKAVDIGARAAVPGGFAAYQGAESAKGIQDFYRLKAAGKPEQAEDALVGAFTNLALAGMSAAGAAKAGIETASVFPAAPREATTVRSPITGQQTPAPGVGLESPSPAFAAQTAEALRQSGRNLAAASWEDLANSRNPVTIRIDGDPYTLVPYKQGRFAGIAVTAEDGTVRYAGEWPTVQHWLRTMRTDFVPETALPGQVPGTGPLTAPDVARGEMSTLRTPTSLTAGLGEETPAPEADPLFGEKLAYLRQERAAAQTAAEREFYDRQINELLDTAVRGAMAQVDFRRIARETGGAPVGPPEESPLPNPGAPTSALVQQAQQARIAELQRRLSAAVEDGDEDAAHDLQAQLDRMSSAPAPAPAAAATTPAGSPSEPAAPPPAPTATPPPSPALPQAPAPGAPGWVGYIPTSSIVADPTRFQFKRNVGQGGAGEELRGVPVWDPVKAGITLVWRDPDDGQTYIVNGHHRLDLANRLAPTQPAAQQMLVRYLDAPNAQEARLQGALANIAEGRGDATDAAKVFRDSGLTPDQLAQQGVSLKGKVAAQGLALSNLAPAIFDDVIAGELSVERGAVIGAGVPNHADQTALYTLLKQREQNGQRLTNDQVGELIRLNQRTSTITESTADQAQGGLFGEEEMTRSLLPEKAEISDYVRKQLGAERKLFGAVSTDAAAQTLTQTGNSIQTAANQQAHQAANQGIQLYDKLSTSAGPIDAILDQSARELAQGQPHAEVKQRAYRAIRDELTRQVQRLTGGQAAGSGVPAESPAPAGQPPAGAGAGNSVPGGAPAGPAATQPEVAPPAAELTPEQKKQQKEDAAREAHNQARRAEFERLSNPEGIPAPSPDEYRRGLDVLQKIAAEDWRGERPEVNSSEFYYKGDSKGPMFEISAAPGSDTERVIAQFVREGVLTPRYAAGPPGHVPEGHTAPPPHYYTHYELDKSKLPPAAPEPEPTAPARAQKTLEDIQEELRERLRDIDRSRYPEKMREREILAANKWFKFQLHELRGDPATREGLVERLNELREDRDELARGRTGDPADPGTDLLTNYYLPEIKRLEEKLNGTEPPAAPGASRPQEFVGKRVRWKAGSKTLHGYVIRTEPGNYIIDPEEETGNAIERVKDTTPLKITKAVPVKTGDRVSFEERRGGWQTREGVVTDVDNDRGDFHIKADDGTPYAGNTQRSRNLKVLTPPAPAAASTQLTPSEDPSVTMARLQTALTTLEGAQSKGDYSAIDRGQLRSVLKDGDRLLDKLGKDAPTELFRLTHEINRLLRLADEQPAPPAATSTPEGQRNPALPPSREHPATYARPFESVPLDDLRARERAASPDQMDLFGERSVTIDDLAKPPRTRRPGEFSLDPRTVRRLSEPGYPADTPTTGQLQMYWGGAKAYARKFGNVPALVVNAPAMDVVLRRMGQVGLGENSRHTIGTVLGPHEWTNILEEARAAAHNPRSDDSDPGFDEALFDVANQIAKALGIDAHFERQAQDNPHNPQPLFTHPKDIRAPKRPPLIVVQAGPRIPDHVLKRVAEEEYDHAQQMELPKGLRSLPAHVVETAAGQKAYEALRRIGYPKLNPQSPFYEHNRAIIVAEIGVRLMRPGRWQELGLTAQEARDLAEAYVKGLVGQNGAKAATIVNQIYESVLKDETLPGGAGGVETQHARPGEVSPGGGRGSPAEETGRDVSGQQPGTLAAREAEEIGPFGPVSRQFYHALKEGEQPPTTKGTTDIPGSHPGEGRTDKAPPSAGGRSNTNIASEKPEVNPARDFLKDETGTSRVAAAARDLYRNLNRRHDDEAKVSYSGLGAWKDKYVRNLSQLEKAHPGVHAQAVKAATSRAQTSALVRASVPRIVEALGKDGPSWLDFRRALIESRLRGIRERWQNMAEGAIESTDEDLHDSFGKWLAPVLKAIHEESVGEPLESPAITAAALLEREDFDGLRAFLEDTFNRAADRVAEMMPDDEFDDITGNPGFARGLDVYKRLLEDPVARNHEENEGVFSDALGPLKTYYPLIRLDEEGEEAHKAPGRSGRAVPYRKPRNIANMFATGHGEAYDPSMEAFNDRIRNAFRVNNKAALIEALHKAGLLRKVKQGEEAPDTITWRGVEYQGVTIETHPDRTLITPNGTVHLPAGRGVIPAWLEEELRPILDKRHLNLSDPKSLIGRITKFTLAGPLDAVIHSSNLIGTLVANTPFLGRSLAAKAAGNLPFTKRAAAILHLINTDPTNEEAARDIAEMAKLGLIPEKYGAVASAWFRKSREFAEQTGAKLERGFGPFLYGPRGVDIRARLLMYRTAKAINPGATPREMYRFVNQLGNYTRALQGRIERSLKESGWSPFYTAGSTMVRNGVNAWTGRGPMPVEGKGGRWLRALTAITGGAVGLIALWLAAHRAYTGKWPWEDPHAKFLAVRLNSEDRNSWLARQIWGPPSNGDAYIGLQWFSPLVYRGARALGIAQMFEAHQVHASADQMMDAAVAGAVNAAVEPVMGPPAKTAWVGITGTEPYITGFRDDRGKPSLQTLGAVEKQKPGATGWVKQHLLGPFLTMNGFLANVGAATGFTRGVLAHADDPENRWLRMIVDLAAPQLFSHPTTTLSHAEFLAKQREALNEINRQETSNRITDALRDRDIERARALAQKAVRDGIASPADIRKAVERARVPKDVAGFRSLGVAAALDAMDAANAEERQRFLPVLAQKLRQQFPRLAAQDQQHLLDRLRELHIGPAEMRAAAAQ